MSISKQRDDHFWFEGSVDDNQQIKLRAYTHQSDEMITLVSSYLSGFGNNQQTMLKAW